jgi:hypothetical protein
MSKIFKIYFYLTMAVLAIPQICYRFKHPQLSETQLFIDFFKAYKEFLGY